MLQTVEMQVHDVRVIGWCDATVYPMSKKKHTLEHLRTHQHLRMRTNLVRELVWLSLPVCSVVGGGRVCRVLRCVHVLECAWPL